MFGSRNLGNSPEEIKSIIEMTKKLSTMLGVPFNLDEMDYLEKVDSW